MSLVGAEKVVSTPMSLFPTRTIWNLDLNSQLAVPPAFDKERMYFGIDGDRLAAYTIADGTQKWLVQARPQKQPAAGDDHVFTAEKNTTDQNEIFARRVADGSVDWVRPLPGALSVAPLWTSGWLIAVTEQGSVAAFHAPDGRPVWTREIGSGAGGTPATAEDRLYVPTRDGRVVALRLESGEPVWERKLGGPAYDAIAIDQRVYVGSQDNFLYCILTKNGSVDWRWRTGGDVIGVPAIDNHRIFFVSFDNVLRSLHRISGAQQWMRPLPVRPVWGPVEVVDRLLVGGLSSTVSAFNVKDGNSGGNLEGGAELAAPPHLVSEPSASLPVVLLVTRDLAKGAAAKLVTRRLEPQSEILTSPLPNVIKMNNSDEKKP